MAISSFKFRTFGDAPHPFDFLEIEEKTAEMETAASIIEAYKAKEKEIYNQKQTVDFSFSEEFFESAKKADADTKQELFASGWEKGKDFIQTPFARLEWEYLGSKIADPNWADGDVSKYEIKIFS